MVGSKETISMLSKLPSHNTILIDHFMHDMHIYDQGDIFYIFLYNHIIQQMYW